MFKKANWMMLFGVLALAVTMVACGSSSNSSNPTSSPGSTTVNVGDDSFNPPNLTVSTGATVTWNWIGSNQHTVTSGHVGDRNAGSLFDSPLQNSGQFQHTFMQAGSFPYFCKIHGSMGMVGTITVTTGSTSGGGGY